MRARIKAIANLVPEGAIVADIGTDHAYLLIELLKSNKINFAYGIDNKKSPLLNAKNNIANNNLEEKCKLILADGLNFQFDKNLDTLVFAGLGGLNVIKMLEDNKNKLSQIKCIVTDIHRDNDRVRSYLEELNFKATQTVKLNEKKQDYLLIKYEK